MYMMTEFKLTENRKYYIKETKHLPLHSSLSANVRFRYAFKIYLHHLPKTIFVSFKVRYSQSRQRRFTISKSKKTLLGNDEILDILVVSRALGAGFETWFGHFCSS